MFHAANYPAQRPARGPAPISLLRTIAVSQSVGIDRSGRFTGSNIRGLLMTYRIAGTLALPIVAPKHEPVLACPFWAACRRFDRLRYTYTETSPHVGVLIPRACLRGYVFPPTPAGLHAPFATKLPASPHRGWAAAGVSRLSLRGYRAGYRGE